MVGAAGCLAVLPTSAADASAGPLIQDAAATPVPLVSAQCSDALPSVWAMRAGVGVPSRLSLVPLGGAVPLAAVPRRSGVGAASATTVGTTGDVAARSTATRPRFVAGEKKAAAACAAVKSCPRPLSCDACAPRRTGLSSSALDEAACLPPSGCALPPLRPPRWLLGRATLAEPVVVAPAAAAYQSR